MGIIIIIRSRGLFLIFKYIVMESEKFSQESMEQSDDIQG